LHVSTQKAKKFDFWGSLIPIKTEGKPTRTWFTAFSIRVKAIGEFPEQENQRLTFIWWSYSRIFGLFRAIG